MSRAGEREVGVGAAALLRRERGGGRGEGRARRGGSAGAEALGGAREEVGDGFWRGRGGRGRRHWLRIWSDFGRRRGGWVLLSSRTGWTGGNGRASRGGRGREAAKSARGRWNWRHGRSPAPRASESWAHFACPPLAVGRFAWSSRASASAYSRPGYSSGRNEVWTCSSILFSLLRAYKSMGFEVETQLANGLQAGCTQILCSFLHVYSQKKMIQLSNTIPRTDTNKMLHTITKTY